MLSLSPHSREMEAQRDLEGERSRRALHVGADAQGSSGVLGERSRDTNWEECVLERGQVVRMGKRRVSSR
jgi:hypothetical protein